MNIQWKQPGQSIQVPSLAFGFDNVAQVIEGRVTVSWYREDAPFKHQNNLVISDFEATNLDIAQTIVDSAANYAKHSKGSDVDGTARDVYPIINDPRLPFRAGLTVHAARGTWSSLPHKFEAEEILTPRPMPFYEKFAYVTDPPGGWGVQMRIGHLYHSEGACNDQDAKDPDEDYCNEWVRDTVVIRDRDIVDIPLGSHPVSGGPGTRLCYVWIYRGALEGREKF
jgi:hypothetical protein